LPFKCCYAFWKEVCMFHTRSVWMGPSHFAYEYEEVKVLRNIGHKGQYCTVPSPETPPVTCPSSRKSKYMLLCQCAQ
jgi:hypothetical protein